jgi:hypothetical protein
MPGELMAYDWTDFVGTIRVLLILVAYLMLQLGRMDGRSPTFSLMNAVGAALILFSLYFKFNFSAFVVELFWLLISIVGLVRGLRLRRLAQERYGQDLQD